MDAIMNQLAQERAERAAISRKNSCTSIGTQALPQGPMDLSSGTTTGDYGQYPSTPEKSESHGRRLSAHNIGTQALPRSPMTLAAGTTQGDIGSFYTTVAEPRSPSSP
eukprot:m.308933 g.308933  ORF g.308933 m.308933 type:complete len:108 (+) comp20196_c0_seq9:99-422(+)